VYPPLLLLLLLCLRCYRLLTGPQLPTLLVVLLLQRLRYHRRLLL
jgi:hypothetical protein